MVSLARGVAKAYERVIIIFLQREYLSERVFSFVYLVGF